MVDLLCWQWFWYQWNRRDPNNPGDMEIVDFMRAHYPPDFRYQQFGSELTAHFFNATAWAEVVAASGAKYFVLTSKHHDGFANWPSSRNFGWNSRDIGQKRDVVGELAGSTFFKNLPSFDLICAVKLSENHSKNSA